MSAIQVNEKNFRDEVVNSDRPVLIDFLAEVSILTLNRNVILNL